MLSSVPYLHCGLKASSIHIPILLTGKLKLGEVKTETPKAQSWEVLELDVNPGYPRSSSLALPRLPDAVSPSWPGAQSQGCSRPSALGHGQGHQ